MKNTNNILAFPSDNNEGDHHLNQVLQSPANNRLTPAQLSTLILAATGALVASASSPAPQPPLLTEPSDDRLQVDRKEAARRLSYSPATIDRLTEKGELRPNRTVGRPMYSIKELQRFVAQGMHVVRPPRIYRKKSQKAEAPE